MIGGIPVGWMGFGSDAVKARMGYGVFGSDAVKARIGVWSLPFLTSAL